MSYLTVDRHTCIRDGLCGEVCPARVIGMDAGDGYPVSSGDFEDSCLRCGHCVAVCPMGALSLEWLSPEDCTPVRQELNVTPEQAEQFLCARRSIRTYEEETVPRAMLEKLLGIACSAPSARNRQPWHWIVVESPSEVRLLAGLVVEWMRTVVRDDPDTEDARKLTKVVAAWDEGYDRVCRGAPHLILGHAERGGGFGAEDCASALTLLDLYATSTGLGTCWGGFFYRAVNAYPPLFEALGLPADHRAFGAMMVGWPRYRYGRIPVRNRPRVTWK